MNKKTAAGCLTLVLAFTYLPFSTYLSWLLFNHVHATDLMWFFWWTTLPFQIAIQAIGALVKIFIDGNK